MRLNALRLDMENLYRKEKYINNWFSGGNCIYRYLTFMYECRKTLEIERNTQLGISIDALDIKYIMKLAKATLDSIPDFRYRPFEKSLINQELMINKIYGDLLKYCAERCKHISGSFDKYKVNQNFR